MWSNGHLLVSLDIFYYSAIIKLKALIKETEMITLTSILTVLCISVWIRAAIIWINSVPDNNNKTDTKPNNLFI